MRKTILIATEILLLLASLLEFFLFLLVHWLNSFPTLAPSSSVMILNWRSDEIDFHFLFNLAFEILLFKFLFKFLQVITIQWDLRVLPLWVMMFLRLWLLNVLRDMKDCLICQLRLKSNIVNALIVLSLPWPINECFFEYIVLNLLHFLLLPVTRRRLIQLLLNTLISPFPYQLLKVEWNIIILLWFSNFNRVFIAFKKGK